MISCSYDVVAQLFAIFLLTEIAICIIEERGVGCLAVLADNFPSELLIGLKLVNQSILMGVPHCSKAVQFG